jgi:hypothetical protein
MASFAPRINVPSYSEIMEQVVQHMPAMYVYNPSPYWIKQQAAGLWFYVPPDLGGKEIHHVEQSTTDKPVMVKADGVLAIYAKYGKDKTKPPIVDVKGIISVLLESRGEMGLCFLPGGPQDAVIKAQAKETWAAFRVYHANRELAAWGEKLNKYNSNPAMKGQYPPIPSKHVQEAIQFLDEYSLAQKDGYAFRCKVCSMITNEDDIWQRHLTASGHSQGEVVVAAPPPIPIPTLVAPTPVNKGKS